MLHLLIHMKLGYTWEKACVFLSMVARKSPLLCAWEMGVSRVNMLDRLLSGMQEGLGWDKGMQNFTMTQTL